MTVHYSVMIREVLEMLHLPQGRNVQVADMTLGYGGHALALLEAYPLLRLWGIDRDQEMLCLAQKRLASYHDRCVFLHAWFDEFWESVEAPKDLDALYVDLGVSLYHFKQAHRGFSFYDETLDMRLDPQLGRSVADLIEHASLDDLVHIFKTYGEEVYSYRYAQAIVQRRKVQKIQSARALAELIVSKAPVLRARQRLHPATRVFQALRIWANDDLARLERALPLWTQALRRGGHLVILSFHSLEDRLVKHYLRQNSRGSDASLRLLTPKPLRPCSEEVRINVASRSALLRCAERV